MPHGGKLLHNACSLRACPGTCSNELCKLHILYLYCKR